MFSQHPVKTPRITYPFGAGGTAWGANKHLGVDYGGKRGTPIYAPAPGFIVWASGAVAEYLNPWEQIPGSGNNGNCVIINHGPEDWATHTLYAHLDMFAVNEGDYVKAGQIIGYMGDTGYAFGVHLHWEMFIDYAEGNYPPGTFYGRVNPLDYFDTVTTTPVAPGNGGGSATQPAKEPFTMSQFKTINDKLDRITAIVTENQRRIGKVPEAVWDHELPMSNGGTTTPARKVKYEAQLWREAEEQRAEFHKKTLEKIAALNISAEQEVES